MDIIFKIDPERITMGDMITLEDSELATWRERRQMMSNHMVNDKGEFIDQKVAAKILTGLTLAQMIPAARQFREKLREMQDAQLPPENGSA